MPGGRRISTFWRVEGGRQGEEHVADRTPTVIWSVLADFLGHEGGSWVAVDVADKDETTKHLWHCLSRVSGATNRCERLEEPGRGGDAELIFDGDGCLVAGDYQ